MKRKISAVIYDNKARKFLVLKRTPERGEFWQCLSGNVEPEESLDVALKREIMEETKLEIAKIFPPILEFHFSDGEKEFIETAFLVFAEGEVVIDSFEHTEYKWCSYVEALDLVKWDKKKIQEASAKYNLID